LKIKGLRECMFLKPFFYWPLGSHRLLKPYLTTF